MVALVFHVPVCWYIFIYHQYTEYLSMSVDDFLLFLSVHLCLVTEQAYQSKKSKTSHQLVKNNILTYLHNL